MKSDGKQARVLICDRIAEVGIELLQQEAEVDVKIGLSPAELQSIVGDYDAVVVRSATKIGAEIIDRADRLKVIGRAGAGLDNIDVITAKERGIKVVNCPDANTRAVAEHTMALILGLARRLPRADLSMKEGRWEKSKLMGTGLVGKTLGIVGFGRIGREVAPSKSMAAVPLSTWPIRVVTPASNNSRSTKVVLPAPLWETSAMLRICPVLYSFILVKPHGNLVWKDLSYENGPDCR
jgi:phosphoglycerate dehydrogenase-like enzyme